jgi:hypothetical protein
VNFKCRLCEKTFESIPADAIRIGRGSVSPLYRLANGEVHAIGSTKVGRHTRCAPAQENAAKAAKEKE